MNETGNLFSNLPAPTPEESFQLLLKGSKFRMERIVSNGHASPEGFWYQQVEAEWVVVIQGHARLRLGDESTHDMVPGSYLLIPAGLRHRVDWTDPDQPTVWLAIHFLEQPEGEGSVSP